MQKNSSSFQNRFDEAENSSFVKTAIIALFLISLILLNL